MKHIALLFIFASTLLAYQPGLKIPQWYQWQLDYKDAPELKQPFVLDFTFSTSYAPLDNLNLYLVLPEGVTLLEGDYVSKIKHIDKDSQIKKSFLLKSTKEIRGLSIQLNLHVDTPKDKISSEMTSLYSSVEKHQLKQALNKVAGLNKVSTLYFQKPLYLLKTEGFKEIPPVIFSDIHQVKDYSSPFIVYSIQEQISSKALLQRITKFEEGQNTLMADAQAFEAYVSNYPTEYKNMLQTNYYSYYQLAFLKVKQGKLQEADEWLQKLSSLILTEEDIDYDFFLVIQNLRSLCNINSKKKAIKILSSAIRTAASSKIRHYLMYNLSVIYEKVEDKAQLKHYLNQALLLNPSFTLAKTMLNKHKGF
ncbi:MAG: hypothetical protein KC646_06655 [Candidatus Cloacimonetes bacterium]|nr:hypothetical protein [Candidatus Cloacimonadota bacterium]